MDATMLPDVAESPLLRITWVVCIVVFLLVFLGWMIVFAMRQRNRRSRWTCPKCGTPFGKAAAGRAVPWHGRIVWLDLIFPPGDGVVLRCNQCGTTSAFSHRGALVDPNNSPR